MINKVFLPEISIEQREEFKAILIKMYNLDSFIDITDENDNVVAWGSGSLSLTPNGGLNYEITTSFLPVLIDTWVFTWDEMMVVHEYARRWGDERGTYGVKFPEQIESIIAWAHQEFFDTITNPTVLQRAAFYWSEIATHQAFHNGNKRTAFLAMLLYLDMNGYTFNLDRISEQSLYEYTVKIANKECTSSDVYNLLFANVTVRIEEIKEEV